MSKGCAACFIKDGIILLQRLEIMRLKAIITGARKAAAAITTEADQVMSSNQPRGVWSYAKGSKLAAQAIKRRLAG